MPKTSTCALAAGVLLALMPVAGPGTAGAQEPVDSARSALPSDSTVLELPSIHVVGSILRAPGPRVGSGLPARTTVIAGEALGAWGARDLPEALEARGGISTYDDLGSPFKVTLVKRGFMASPVVGLPQGLSVFVDGVPVNEPDAGQVNFDLLPLDHVARVEILSGTASLLGPHSLGGAVNLVTRRGGGDRAGEVGVRLGSNGLQEATASTGGSVGSWSYFGGGGWGREEGWRQLTAAEQYGGLVNLAFAEGGGALRLQAYGGRSRAETAGSLPFSVYTVQPDSNLSAGDFEDLRQVHLAASGHAPVGGGLGSLRIHARAHDAERFNVNQPGDPDVRSFSRNRTLGGSADWRRVFRAPKGTVGLRLGADGALNRTEVRIHAERIDPGLTTHVRSPIREAGGYGIVEYGRSRVTASVGARLDVVRVPFRNLLDGTRDTTSTFGRVSPRAAVRVEVLDGLSLHSSAGRSFRAPSVIELACADPEEPCPLPFALGDDPPLDPVVATTYETGARYVVGPLLLEAALYRTDVQGEILLFPYEDDDEPEGSTIDGFFDNIERTRREGLELESVVTLTGGHSLFLNYAYTRATFRVDGLELFSIRQEAGGRNVVEAGDRMPMIPDHELGLGALFALPMGLEVGVQGSYTGRRWLRGDEANEAQPLDPYWVADVRAGYQLGDFELQGVVHNVTDASYASFGTFNLNQGAGGRLERFLTPGAPRRVSLGLDWTLGDR